MVKRQSFGRAILFATFIGGYLAFVYIAGAPPWRAALNLVLIPWMLAFVLLFASPRLSDRRQAFRLSLRYLGELACFLLCIKPKKR